MQANPISYQPRELVDLGIAQIGWNAKIYGILGTGRSRAELPPEESLVASLAAPMAQMDGPHDHNCGFAIFHLADDGFYLLLTRFNNANNLAHRVWSIGMEGERLILSPLGDERIIACVWEIGLMHFEARAWIECVLTKGLNIKTEDAYLSVRATGPV